MKAFKGFDKNLQCKGFQYEVGKTYEEESASLCNCGFHACEAPLDVLGYYPPNTSRYCEVELDDVTEEMSDDSKRVGKKIKIGAEIGIAGLVKAHVGYVREEVKDCPDGSSGDDAKIECEADHAVVACVGKRGRCRAAIGAWITLAEYGEYDGEGWPCICVKSFRIDGLHYKPGVWYTLRDGNVVRADDES